MDSSPKNLFEITEILISKKHHLLLTILFFLIFLFLPEGSYAWPTTGQWMPVYKGGVILQDDTGDSVGSRNIVSDSTHAAAFIFNDGTYVHFRLRLDQNPSGTGGQGLLQSFGWGVALDTDNNVGSYEWLFMLDGISRIETIGLWHNTIQGTLGDPSDKPEILQSSIDVAGNYQVSAADTAINGDTDYFLDWRFPYATFKQATGFTDSSPIRLFFGSSTSTNNLSADLVGASDLYAGFSDIVTIMGTTPTTGTVKFVADLAGNGDVIQINAGDTLYLSVVDGDLNYNKTTTQQVTVTLTALSGDTAVVTATETGVNTGIFTASIPTQSGTPVANDGILQVTPGTTVSVEYIDGIDASYNRNQVRADSVWIISLNPVIALIKSMAPETAAPGTEITYTVHYRNSGLGVASNLIIADSIPPFTTYVAGSLRIGTAATTYDTATVLTDAADTDAGQFSGSVLFTVSAVVPDDGIDNSGDDEGKIYFKVRVD